MLTPQQLEAALLVAENRLSHAQIAKRAGCGYRTLTDWKALPEFKREVEAHRKAWQRDIRLRGVADMHQRLRVAKDLHTRLMAAIAQRGADPKMKQVPGGDTGMVCITYKSIRTEEGSELVPEYKIDNETARTILEVQQYIATELGQWKTKHVIEEKVEYTERVIYLAQAIPPNVLAEVIRKAEQQDGPDDGNLQPGGTEEGEGVADKE